MTSLIDGMLLLSRSGRQALSAQRIDLGELAVQARRDVGAEFGHHPVRWRIDALPEVWGDRGMLQQVMTNLLSNAVKYSSARQVSEIHVWARESASEWTISVQDNGVGLQSQVRPQAVRDLPASACRGAISRASAWAWRRFGASSSNTEEGSSLKASSTKAPPSRSPSQNAAAPVEPAWGATLSRRPADSGIEGVAAAGHTSCRNPGRTRWACSIPSCGGSPAITRCRPSAHDQEHAEGEQLVVSSDNCNVSRAACYDVALPSSSSEGECLCSRQVRLPEVRPPALQRAMTITDRSWQAPQGWQAARRYRPQACRGSLLSSRRCRSAR